VVAQGKRGIASRSASRQDDRREGIVDDHTLRRSGDCHVRRKYGSLCVLQFDSWCRVPRWAAKFSQVDENLSASGIPTVESICVSQICLRAEIVIIRAAVVRW
jgi:hypothetical protein